MIDEHELYERAIQRFTPPDGAFDRLRRRRHRKIRNQRIAAGVLGVMIAVAGVGATAWILRPQLPPAKPRPTPIPRPALVRPVVIGTDGKLRQVLPALPSGASWIDLSPDGTTFVFVLEGRVAETGIHGGKIRFLTHPRPARSEMSSITHPVWSPDGSRIAFETAGPMFSDPHRIDMMDAAGGHLRTLVRCAREPVWSPDGTHIAYEGGPTCDVQHDVYSIGVTGGTPTFIGDGAEPAWSFNGTAIAFMSTRRGPPASVHPTMVAANGLAEITRGRGFSRGWLTDAYFDELHGSVSPDGRTVALLQPCGSRGGTEITLVGVDGASATTLPGGCVLNREGDVWWLPSGDALVVV
ncbi:MAG TPA: hypothetical protein VLX89_09810 [Actinomycetota bacterium]|nr:hypothetical protein [Actinomycetota bacterium]